ncbi:vesicular integral-membrane protein VIP36 [Sitophilus oryzae]|uniref:Vesicular integral-membrane protein VIP36 n=1 Tax=Sitophilus oryzae TaxID=7048 RepID=A0A6J2Y6P2_SITOR|nr:vesicular integral-membrane protein VIP36 [Sitophilus oryzae]
MTLSNYITCFLIFFILEAVQCEWNTKDFMRQEHSLIKPYYKGMYVPKWDITGYTVIADQQHIRLTEDKQSQRGSIWNAVPLKSKNWELQVQFKVHGKGHKDLFGDGLAIWYTKDRLQDGPVFGSKDFFSGLAIFLDTYSNHNGPHNHQHPYISAMINNGTMHYDHDRDGTHTQLAGCEAKFRNLNYDTYIAIRYENDVLTVSTDIENKAAWRECFKIEGVQLPTGYYIGASASTGDLSDTHDILAIRLYDLDSPDDPKEDRSNIIPSAAFFDQPRDHVDDPKPSTSGVKIFLYTVFGLIMLIVIGVVGIMYYQKQSERNRKRFY